MKSLKFILFAVFSIAVLSSFSAGASASSEPVSGVVIFDAQYDYHIVETRSYFVIVEWYSGPDFSKGDRLYGELHSYNFKMVRVNKNERETKVYIENYWSSRETCMEWLKDNGKL